MRDLKHPARAEREEHPPHGAGHASDADYGAHCALGEHVGGGGEEIRRPSLMRGGGEAEQSDGDPFGTRPAGEEDGDDHAGKEQHGEHARFDHGSSTAIDNPGSHPPPMLPIADAL